MTLGESAGPLPPIPPGESGEFFLNLPPGWERANALSFEVTGPRNGRLCTWAWPVADAEATAQKALAHLSTAGPEPAPADPPIATGAENASPKAPPTATSSDPSPLEDETAFILEAGGIRARIAKATGRLAGIETPAGPVSLGNGPAPARGEAKLVDIRQFEEDGTRVVEASYTGALLRTRWSMPAGGVLKLESTYAPEPDSEFLGITFSYPDADSTIRGIRWMGGGPGTVWKNRMKGVRFGVWENARAGAGMDALAGYRSGLRWLQINSREQPITIVTNTPGLFLHLRAPVGAGDAARRPASPSGDLSFLQGIPPAGSKFHTPIHLGPRGAPNLHGVLAPESRDITLWFVFGR